MILDELDAALDELDCANDSHWTISARNWGWLIGVRMYEIKIAQMQKAIDKLYGKHNEELDSEEQKYFDLGKREMNNVIYYAKEHLENFRQEEIPPDLKFDNITRTEQRYAKLCEIGSFITVDQMVRDACKKYNAGRDKVILQDYVVKEVLKKEKDPEKLRESDEFLSHLLGARLKTARRWGLSESEYHAMKEHARERLRASI